MTKTKKPDLSNVSLDDIIEQSKPKKKIKKRKGAPAAPTDVDYTKFSDAQIKKQLEKKGMPTTGSRKKLEARLQHCVRQAWAQYEKQMRKGTVKPKKKNKKPKTKLSEEERKKIQEQNEANRKAKLAKKAANKKKAEAARKAALERKRKKKEASDLKKADLDAAQKVQKEARQSLEAFAAFDIKALAAQVRKKFDPKNKNITNIQYDFSKKGFVIKFKKPMYVEAVTKGAHMKKPVTAKFNVTTSVLPAPVESQCVFFLSPTSFNHTDKQIADEWVAEQGGEDLPELDKLQLWIDSAQKTFNSCGKIINVYRERGFMVVHFASSSSADKFIGKYEGGEFNGVPFQFLKAGTPTKQDRNQCDEEFPRPKKKKN